MPITELPGKWSFLETLGEKIGQNIKNRRAEEDRQREISRQRTQTLAELAGAGLLPPDGLAGSAAADLDRLGIPKQSIVDMNTQARRGRQAKLEADRLAAQRVQAQIDADRARTGLLEKQASILAPKEPPAPKTLDYQRKASMIWNGSLRNRRAAEETLAADPDFAQMAPQVRAQWLNDAIQRAKDDEKKGITIVGLGDQRVVRGAHEAVMAAQGMIDPATPPEQRKEAVTAAAWNLLKSNPQGQQLIRGGLDSTAIMAAYVAQAKKDSVAAARGKKGTSLADDILAGIAAKKAAVKTAKPAVTVPPQTPPAAGAKTDILKKYGIQ